MAIKTQAPAVRIGIIGLSSKAGAWATIAHLPRLAQSPNFEIVALCNSSLASTHAAIKAHNLPESTRAYDSYDEIAADQNVDLYVVSTRADTHYEVALPALKAGMNTFIEWPLAATLDDAREMARLAKQNKARTMIGFQARASPSILKIKEIVDGGILGDIHSVNYTGVVNVWQDNIADERYWHFVDRKAGGTLLTIYGGHTLDAIFFALGELLPGSYKPMALNIRKEMRVRKADGTLTTEILQKDTPDQMLLQGQLERRPPAAFSFHLRAGPRFDKALGSTWRIFGTKGELVVNFTSAGPQMAKALSMQIRHFDTDELEHVLVDEGGPTWTALPNSAQNIGRLYEAYAKGEGYADFDLAVKRHELIEEFWKAML